jgi:fumarylacetoacetase
LFLNDFVSLPIGDRRFVRDTIIQNLTNADSPLFKDDTLSSVAFVAMDQVRMHLPMRLTDYTDFFSSLVDAEHVSTFIRAA